MGKNFSKNQHFADFSACSGHPAINYYATLFTIGSIKLQL
jgi:hypothetical protein